MARSFNGTSDYITIGNIASLNVTGAMSISAWVYLAAGFTGSGFKSVHGKWAASGNRSYLLSMGGSSGSFNGAVFFADGGGTTYSIVSTQPQSFFVGSWNHIMGTITPGLTGTMNLYVNGAFNGTLGITKTALLSNTQANEIGNDTAGDYWNGNLAECAIWNGDLSSNLNAIAALGKVGGCRAYKVTDYALLGYWPLFGYQSPEPDMSSNGNVGTLTGTAAANHPPIDLFNWTKPSSLAVASGSPPTVTQRRTSSQLGTRVGSRQPQRSTGSL
jgi:hypothetical protein